MHFLKKIFPAPALALALALPNCAHAARPIAKEALLQALKRGGMSNAELTAVIKSTGAGFALTPADEKDLAGLGADPALLEAIRASRVSGNVRSEGRPLAPVELVTKLFHGNRAAAAKALETRGAGFDLDPALEAQILEAGGDKPLLALAALRRLDFEPSPRPAPPEPAEDSAPPPVAQAAVPRAVESGPKPIRVDASTQARKLARRGDLDYPQMALRARMSGRVVVEALIGRDGRVRRARVLRGDEIFRDAALQSVLRNVYRPTLLDEEAVEVVAEVSVDFDPSLAGSGAPN